jgi:hypothetical protein
MASTRQDPDYNQRLLQAFYYEYNYGTVKPKLDDALDAEFDRVYKRVTRTLNFIRFAVVGGIFLFDRRVLVPRLGDQISLTRATIVFGLLIPSSLLIDHYGQSPYKDDLANAMAVKYQRKLHDFNPQLDQLYEVYMESTGQTIDRTQFPKKSVWEAGRWIPPDQRSSA